MVLRRLNAEPDGNCRVYYRGDSRALYCWQEDHRDKWSFYCCSQDGEPSHMVVLRADQPAAPGATTAEWAHLAQKAGV